MSSGSAGSIDLDLGLNFGAFSRQLNGIAGTASNMVGGAFKKLGGIIAGAFAIHSMVSFGKAAINLASDLQEVQNVVDVTFGSMAAEVDAWSTQMIESFGLSELSAKKYASTMGAMLKSSGLSGVAMKDMSKNLTELTADMASFYNLSTDMAFDKIRAGISGETEPLKQLGINMSVANLEAYALSKGITKSYQAMSQAEQVLLRYNYLLSVTKDAQGDFLRNGDSWANQLRVLSERFRIFQGTMGQGFINILTPVIGWINKLIAKLQIAAEYFKAFTELIFGAQKNVGSSAATVGVIGSAATDAADGMSDLSGATADAGKAAKKAGKEVKGSLGNFDQLNVIGQQAADALGDAADGMADIGAGAGGVDLGSAMTGELPTPDMTAFQPLLDFLGNVKTLAGQAWEGLQKVFGPPLRQVFIELMPPLLSWKNTLSKTFSEISALGAPFLSWFKKSLIPLTQQYITTAGHIWAGLLDSAEKVFTGIKDAAMPVLTWFVTEGLPLLTEFASAGLTVFQSMFDNAKIIFDKLWAEGAQPGLMLLSSMLVEELDIYKRAWDTFGDDIVSGLTTAFDNTRKLFVNLWDVVLKPIWDNFLKEMKWLWDNHLKGLVEQFTIFVGKLVTGALDIYNKVIVPVIDYLVKKFGPAWSNAFQGITSIISTFLSVVIDIVKGILKALGGVIDFVVGIFTGDWDKAWNGVKDIFGGIWDGIVAIVKGAVNVIVDLINVIIRAWNSLKFEVPKVDLGPLGSFGGWTIGMPSLKEIPKLAKGGLVGAPTLAMVGDNRNAASDPEVVTPLSKLSEMLGQSNQAVVEALMMILDAIENQQTSLEIDGEKLTRVIRDKLKVEGGRVGRSTVTVGGVSLR